MVRTVNKKDGRFDPARCNASVYAEFGHFGQCYHKHTVERKAGKFCKKHDPEPPVIGTCWGRVSSDNKEDVLRPPELSVLHRTPQTVTVVTRWGKERRMRCAVYDTPRASWRAYLVQCRIVLANCKRDTLVAQKNLAAAKSGGGSV